MYRALYRKWRPQRFADVVGQTAIVTALQNQISAGRIGHAYLFTGTRGTGKTAVNGDQRTLLEILADKLCRAVPGDNIQPVSLTLAVSVTASAITGDAERRNVLARRSLAQLRVRGKAAHDCNNIQHWFTPYSSTARVMLRRTPSVILKTRSSSAGKSGSLVKLITVYTPSVSSLMG